MIRTSLERSLSWLRRALEEVTSDDHRDALSEAISRVDRVRGACVPAPTRRRGLEAARLVVEQGLTRAEAARRVGVTGAAVAKSLQRHFGVAPRPIRRRAR